MTRRQLTDPFGSDDEDERFVAKWTRLSNIYNTVTFMFPLSSHRPDGKFPSVL
jgi:hypothetical protein